MPLISDFTGSDENPLSEGGNWAILNSSLVPLKLISNSAASGGAGAGSSYWTPSNFGPDIDAHVTISTEVNSQHGIGLRIQGEGGANTWDGYTVFANNTTTVRISRFDNGVETALITVTPGFTWGNGDKLGVRISGSTIKSWRQASGSSNWDFVCAAIDATYASAGKIALLAGSPNVRLDDLYAFNGSSVFPDSIGTFRH